MGLTFAMDAVNETFADCEETIKNGVRSFCRRRQLDPDEALGLAHEAFMEAYWDKRFDSERASFTTWVASRVYYKLLEAWDRQRSRHSVAQRAEGAKAVHRVFPDLDSLPRAHCSWHLIDFLDELSDDAQTVVRITLEAPGDVRLCLIEKGNCFPRTIRAALREFLRDCGWTASRIAESFAEIRQALSR